MLAFENRLRLTIGTGDVCTDRTLLRSITHSSLFFSNPQFLKIKNQFIKFFDAIIFIARSITMTRSPQFQIFNSIIRFITIFMMNRFSWKQISTQMFFHNQTVFLNIKILCPRMFGLTNHNITSGSLSASPFPSWVMFPFKMFSWYLSFGTNITVARQCAHSQSISDFSYWYPFSRMASPTYTINHHAFSFPFRKIFYNLGRTIIIFLQTFRKFIRIKWISVFWTSLHSKYSILYRPVFVKNYLATIIISVCEFINRGFEFINGILKFDFDCSNQLHVHIIYNYMQYVKENLTRKGGQFLCQINQAVPCA